MQNLMKQILPVVGCVLLLFGAWLLVHANDDIQTPNDTPTPITKPEPIKSQPKPGSEPGTQGSIKPPEPPPDIDESLKAPVADAPCDENTCKSGCGKKVEAGAPKKQYIPVPWVAVPGLPEPSPMASASDQTTEDQTMTKRVRRKILRRP